MLNGRDDFAGSPEGPQRRRSSESWGPRRGQAARLGSNRPLWLSRARRHEGDSWTGWTGYLGRSVGTRAGSITARMGARHPSYCFPTPPAARRRSARRQSCSVVERHDQTVRLRRAGPCTARAGLRVLDVVRARGPARFFHQRAYGPAHYIGLEAQRCWSTPRGRRRFDRCTIIPGGFRAAAGSDVTSARTWSSLRLAEPAAVAGVLSKPGQGVAATRRCLAFNFLSSPELTGRRWLHWHRPAAVVASHAPAGRGGLEHDRRLRIGRSHDRHRQDAAARPEANQQRM